MADLMRRQMRLVGLHRRCKEVGREVWATCAAGVEKVIANGHVALAAHPDPGSVA